MICKSCGAEVVSGKKFCPKCGMPMVDYEVRPEADEEIDAIKLSKRLKELKPIVDAIVEKEEKEKEEAARKKEEELEKKRKERLAMLEEDDEEDFDLDEDDLEDDDLDEDWDENPFDEEEGEIVLCSGTETDEVAEVHSKKSIKKSPDDPLDVSEIIDDIYMYEGTCQKVHGDVCYISMSGDITIFNIEDDFDSISCHVDVENVEEIEHDGFLYTKEDILNVLESIKRGNALTVEGTLMPDDNGDVFIDVISIEGEDFYIRCA